MKSLRIGLVQQHSRRFIVLEHRFSVFITRVMKAKNWNRWSNIPALSCIQSMQLMDLIKLSKEKRLLLKQDVEELADVELNCAGIA